MERFRRKLNQKKDYMRVVDKVQTGHSKGEKILETIRTRNID